MVESLVSHLLEMKSSVDSVVAFDLCEESCECV